MRFVSHSPSFMIQIIPERTHATPYGDLIVDREGYIAHFSQGDITDADLAFAAQVWPMMPGQTVLIDEITPVPLMERVSVFDTDEVALREEWEGRTTTDARGNVHDFKTYVEQFLAARAVNHQDFRQVEEIPLAPPWPNYLQFRGSLDQLVRILVDQGHDLAYVARYERQIGRQQVWEAIDAEMARQAEEIEDAPQVLA